MTTSLHSSTKDSGEDCDLEAFDEVEIADAPAEKGHNASEKSSSPWEVTLEKSEDPMAMTTWRKWTIVLTISCGSMCVTSASSMVGTTSHISPGSDLTRSYL